MTSNLFQVSVGQALHAARCAVLGGEPLSQDHLEVLIAAASTYQEDDISAAVETLVKRCHGDAFAAGWWTDLATGQPREKPVPEALMLVVSEIAEAMEGHRKNLQDDKLPEFQMIEVELADAIIRICDLAGGKGYRLAKALSAKLAFNRIRPDHKPAARTAEGGKAY